MKTWSSETPVSKNISFIFNEFHLQVECRNIGTYVILNNYYVSRNLVKVAESKMEEKILRSK